MINSAIVDLQNSWELPLGISGVDILRARCTKWPSLDLASNQYYQLKEIWAMQQLEFAKQNDASST